MNEYGYNKKYLTKNGAPWFPVMGEFHYSRYPMQYWKESLYKMKVGGVEIVSAYVFWLHHEEIQSCPELPNVPEGFEAAGRKGGFYCYRRTGALPTGKATWNEVPEVKAAVTADVSKRTKKRYEISLSYPAGCPV